MTAAWRRREDGRRCGRGRLSKEGICDEVSALPVLTTGVATVHALHVGGYEKIMKITASIQSISDHTHVMFKACMSSDDFSCHEVSRLFISKGYILHTPAGAAVIARLRLEAGGSNQCKIESTPWNYRKSHVACGADTARYQLPYTGRPAHRRLHDPNY
jgi:hypothetical protein